MDVLRPQALVAGLGLSVFLLGVRRHQRFGAKPREPNPFESVTTVPLRARAAVGNGCVEATV